MPAKLQRLSRILAMKTASIAVVSVDIKGTEQTAYNAHAAMCLCCHIWHKAVFWLCGSLCNSMYCSLAPLLKKYFLYFFLKVQNLLLA